MPPASPYKEYRIFLQTATGSYIIATSNTVNDLVLLSKMWLERTSAGMYLPPEAKGMLILQKLDPVTGAYQGQEQIEFERKDDIIGQLRKLGGR